MHAQITIQIFLFVFTVQNKLKLSVLGYRCDNSQSVLMFSKDLPPQNRTDRNKDSHKRLKCNLCPYSTYRRWNLKRHLTLHSGERPHKCEICNRGFTRRDNLKDHWLLHTGEKPYSCNECNKSFKERRSLTKHILKHM